ncbi:uncharacterized protein LOC117610678 [Osmia lignaria lignaria]|uniref:ras-interacting protein RIP3-like n=1 Tax=Osmia lignaria TaxID=473952 RepID=UPI0014796C21|nr:ras-interacting protein RIP3-like [Osmia lignaria]XP_034194206.1 ras-interacting protein RIP3-like [Osmia lignaria]
MDDSTIDQNAIMNALNMLQHIQQRQDAQQQEQQSLQQNLQQALLQQQQQPLQQEQQEVKPQRKRGTAAGTRHRPFRGKWPCGGRGGGRGGSHNKYYVFFK